MAHNHKWKITLLIFRERTNRRGQTGQIACMVVLVALTDKFNALFHHGNFPVG